jgi:hypothetical protein
MLVQRLDHDSAPVPDGWIIFHTVPCQPVSISAKSQDKSAHCISRPLTRRIWVCRSSLVNWAKFKNQSCRGGSIQAAHRLYFLKGADYNSSIH